MKVKGTFVDQMSGSLAGITASRNRGGQYLRHRAVPTNPNSPAQQGVRSTFAALATAYTTVLTNLQRAAWNAYAEANLRPDRLGEPRNIGGMGWYIRCNTVRLLAGVARVDDAPTVNALAEWPQFPTPFDNAPDSSLTVEVQFDATQDWVSEDGAGVLVQMSDGQNPSVNFFKGPFRKIGAILGDSVTPPPSPEPIDVTGIVSIAAGQVAFTRGTLFLADGRISDPIIVRNNVG